MNIAYRFRIYPTEEQKILLGKTFGCCRFLYNQMLNDKIQEYKKSKTMLKNTPAMYKKTYSFLKEVDSLALANVQLHLEKAYKNFFRDPKVNPDAVKYDEISIQEVVDKKLAAMDLTASIMCLEQKMPMMVFALDEENSIINTVHGKFSGTKVTV